MGVVVVAVVVRTVTVLALRGSTVIVPRVIEAAVRMRSVLVPSVLVRSVLVRCGPMVVIMTGGAVVMVVRV